MCAKQPLWKLGHNAPNGSYKLLYKYTHNGNKKIFIPFYSDKFDPDREAFLVN